MRTSILWPSLCALALCACQMSDVRTVTTPAVPAPPPSAALPGVAPPAAAPTSAASGSPWDDARTRGVGFRAVGDEPGWSVEVDKGATPPLRAMLDYGQRSVQVAHSVPFADPAAGTVGFRGNDADGVRIELTIQRGQCQDASGASFDASADLAVGAQHYKGCGRFLFP